MTEPQVSNTFSAHRFLSGQAIEKPVSANGTASFLWSKVRGRVELDSKTEQKTSAYNIREFGDEGEVYMVHDDCIEVWDWVIPGKMQSDRRLWMVAKVTDLVPRGFVLKVFPICSRRHLGGYFALVLVRNAYKELQFLVVDFSAGNVTGLTYAFTGHDVNFVVKGLKSTHHFAIGSSNGTVVVYNVRSRKRRATYSCIVVNNEPVFDLCGDWLIYNAPSQSKSLKKWRAEHDLTPLKLSRHISLLNKLWKGLSKTALDSVLMFSEISHSKFRKFFSREGLAQSGEQASGLSTDDDELLRSHNFREMLAAILNTLNVNSNYLLMVDLARNQTMFCFSPPDGCSAVSLSPFDLSVATVTNRGDDVYLWDYSKFDKDITLLDKYKRGKTSAVISDILWTSNNQSLVLLSKPNGSVHLFVNESLTGMLQSRPSSRQLSDNQNAEQTPFDWCISNANIKKISIPTLPMPLDYQRYHTEISALTDAGNVVRIDQETGRMVWKYTPPAAPSTTSMTGMKEVAPVPLELQLVDPIAEAEVETCKPFPFVYNNRRIQYAKFKNASESLRLDGFGSVVADFEDVKFGRFNGSVKFHSTRSEEELAMAASDNCGSGVAENADQPAQTTEAPLQ
ncbi:hypothetical protein KL949_004597 [Ogataea haglerorum]|nr:hypothetical protein KL949_004597 [Ogataea haglerorum]KAG7714961.1 hypothetical protein KL913_004282 [Ogataea haglerorum]